MAETDDDVAWEYIKTMPPDIVPPFDSTDGTEWPFGITADGDFDEEAATMATYAVRGVFYDRNDTTLMQGDTRDGNILIREMTVLEVSRGGDRAMIRVRCCCR